VAAILRELPLPALAHDQIVLQLQLAEYFFFRQRWEDAEALFEASLQSTVGAVNDAVMVFATSRLADLKVMKGDLEGADRLLSDVREEASALPVGHQWAAFMSTVARVAYERNRTDDAARTWLEVVSHGAVLTPSQQVDALLGLSGIALERGDWSEADTLMLKALSLSTPLGPRAVASALRLASAFAARARGRGHELRAVGPELQQSLLNAARHVSSDADLAALLARLGEFILIRSDAVTAERLLRRALEIQRRTLPSADPMLAETLRHLAMAIATLGNRHEAVVLLRESIEITTAVYGPNSPEIAGLRSVVESLSQTTQS
jgi:tetratricopeptide (TPR) repeat protein